MSTKTVWVLVTEDPNVVGGRMDEVPGAMTLPSSHVVTVHHDFDNVMEYIRATYDPSGYYADEGSGSLQNYLSGEGYSFHYSEVPIK
ncbi:Uncharacterised protein [Mycobacteroides abscessus subsp. abscessus]|uniref:hypothetical protein n=1 Tax=Mycobacteroides abscessus TaxID=36809 RepID=UPI00092AE560|nr:hypothetical protein [Mycobacteroides abscessus]SIH33704.1 Uncharacterised protein [Mycobacteroides abscessus subsp. abscessus]